MYRDFLIYKEKNRLIKLSMIQTEISPIIKNKEVNVFIQALDKL